MKVLGVPLLNRPDLLARMLASVDLDFDRIVVIDNSTGRMTDEVALPDNAIVIAPRHNLGVGLSWELIVKATPLADWWCIVNNDVEFASGDLASLADQVAREPESFSFLVTPSCFAWTPQVIERVGWPDQNFVPGYFEDNDYVRRCLLAGVRVVALPAGYRHDTSSTIGSDQKIASENAKTFPLNSGYYHAKWGGPPGGERFSTPFDAGGDIRDWRLSIKRLRDQTWKIK
jgi:GT2 family glycosyltransferase